MWLMLAGGRCSARAWAGPEGTCSRTPVVASPSPACTTRTLMHCPTPCAEQTRWAPCPCTVEDDGLWCWPGWWPHLCPSNGHPGALAVPGTLQQHPWLQHIHFWRNYRTFAPIWSTTPCLYCPWCQSGPCFGVVSGDPISSPCSCRAWLFYLCGVGGFD